MTPRYKRGDKHPSNAELFFFRYGRGKEVWVSREKLERKKSIARRIDKKWKKSPQGREYMRKYFEKYNQLPKQKSYHSSYYKQTHVREKYKARYQSNPDVKSKQRAYQRKLQKESVAYRFYNNLRRRIWRALRNPTAIKSARTFELIGCSISALKLHLESQFTEGMTWENYGGYWHVDHRLPLAMFDLTDPKQQKIAFHFENLRPLLAAQNMAKSDKIEGELFRGRDLRKIIPFKAA